MRLTCDSREDDFRLVQLASVSLAEELLFGGDAVAHESLGLAQHLLALLQQHVHHPRLHEHVRVALRLVHHRLALRHGVS